MDLHHWSGKRDWDKVCLLIISLCVSSDSQIYLVGCKMSVLAGATTAGWCVRGPHVWARTKGVAHGHSAPARC